MDWFDLLAVQGTLKNLLQHCSSKASILQCSAFFIVQLSHPYMTTGQTIALTRWTFVGKVMSLLFTMLSRLVIAFLPRSKCLLISMPFSQIIPPVGSQCEESHPWQGHVTEALMGKANQASGFSPGISWACTPTNKNLTAFPLFWHTLEKVNSGL